MCVRLGMVVDTLCRIGTDTVPIPNTDMDTRYETFVKPGVRVRQYTYI